MVYKITGEQPFQVLSDSFSISPSEQNYTVQVSADGNNYSDLFAVSAGQTKMCTGMSNGSFYRLKNNQSEVSVNWRTTCKGGEGGGSFSGGSADYATLAGESNKSKLLEGSSALPQDANTGDVVAVAATPTRGLRSANTIGIYQYDGSSWNKIEGGSGSGSSYEPYKIELSEVDPSNYTQEDRATLNAFCTAYSADTSIADSAYISALNGIYRCVRYSSTVQGFSTFIFEGSHNNNIVDIELHFLNNTFVYGGLQDAVPSPDFTTLEAVSELPQDANTGDVVAVSTPAQEGKWIEFDASENPTKVRIMTKSDGTYLLHFNNNNLYTGLDYTAGDPPTFSGSGWGLQQDDTYNWHYENNGYYISVWAEQEGDDWYIYAEMTQGEGGFSMIDAYGLGSWSEMYVGGTEGSIGVYQYDGSDWNAIGGGEGGGDFIHLDSIDITGEVGKTYEFEGRLMKWVEGSGYTAEWLSNIANIDNGEGTGLIYSTIPDGQKLFEYKYSYGGEWRYVIYSGGTLYCTETGGTVVSSATIGQTFIFPTTQYDNYQVKGYFENGHIGFIRNGSVSFQNVWDGNAANSHYELIDKYNYPYTNVQSNGVEAGIAKWNKYGQVVKKQGDISTKAIQFNTNASQYSSTGKITFYTDGINNGPDRIYVPTNGGTSGQVLVSNGDNAAPTFQSWIKVVKITSDAYDALVQAGTTDPNTLYAIVDE